MNSLEIEIFKLHEEACKHGETEYRDPKTGYTVFTKIYHLRRGVCCGSQCRHCPFGYVNVRNKP